MLIPLLGYMEIPDPLLAFIILYILVVTLLVIGSISQYSSKKIEPKNESIKQGIKKLQDLKTSLLVGIFTGAVVVVYYNWANCVFFECKTLPSLNLFNPWFISAFIVATIAILAFVACYVGIWILQHRKE